jgi:hypothetical protein
MWHTIILVLFETRRKMMRKAVIGLFAFLVIFGCAVSGVMAQTTWWVWGAPKEINNDALYDTIEAWPLHPTLYGCVGSICEEIALGSDVTSVVPGDPTFGTYLADVDAPDGTNYGIDTDTTVAMWDGSNYIPLDVQPDVPSAVGTFKSIAVGEDGRLYILFGSATLPQYLVEQTPPEVTVRFTPRSLNLGSHGKWVTCKISGLPEDYSAGDINLDSLNIVAINGESITAIPRAPGSPSGGRNKLMVKFDRQVLAAAIGEVNGNVELTVTGTWGDEELPFFGTDTFKTKFKAKKNPK